MPRLKRVHYLLAIAVIVVPLALMALGASAKNNNAVSSLPLGKSIVDSNRQTPISENSAKASISTTPIYFNALESQFEEVASVLNWQVESLPLQSIEGQNKCQFPYKPKDEVVRCLIGFQARGQSSSNYVLAWVQEEYVVPGSWPTTLTELVLIIYPDKMNVTFSYSESNPPPVKGTISVKVYRGWPIRKDQADALIAPGDILTVIQDNRDASN